MAEQTIPAGLSQLERYRKYIDMAEIRADFLEPDELHRISVLPTKSPVPLILTVRREAEGGHFQGDEKSRSAVLAEGVVSGFTYVDMESDVDFGEVETACERTDCRIIRSLHDFGGVPENLSTLIKEMPRSPREIPKVAVMPRSLSDLRNIMSAVDANANSEKIVIGMGPWGFITRILARRLGSYLTFTSPENTETAPGHIDPITLCGTYRFREVGPNPDIYCVIANPVMHSRSPWIHNPALHMLNLNAVYVPIQVDDVPLFFELADALQIKGASITVPHKQTVRASLDQEDEAVSAVGSCNTAYRSDGSWYGTNTDVGGFLVSLTRAMGGADLRGLHATVVGAGGTSRAVVYALTSRGVDVCIVNRTEDRAIALAEEFGCEWASLDSSSVGKIRDFSEIIVQTTSAGMHPNVDIDPLSFFDFSGREFVYDVIYAPAETKLLKRAKTAGCKTCNGEQMLLEQAYLQFKLFTGFDYPRECRDIDVFSRG